MLSEAELPPVLSLGFEAEIPPLLRRDSNDGFLQVNVKEDGDDAGGYAKTMSSVYQAAQLAMYAEQVSE